MVKIIIAGVWACVVTLVAVYFSVQMATAPAKKDDGAKEAPVDVVRGEPITVPYTENGAVKGYFLARFTFVVDQKLAKDLKVPLTALTTDELFTLLVGNSVIDMTGDKPFDLAAFRKSLLEDLNRLSGSDLVKTIYIEQLDFLAKEETREANGRPRLKPAVKIINGDTPPVATKRD